MKYIINKNGPVLFPSDVPHETFGEFISCGFCVFWFNIESNRFECFTLPEITATPDDYKIIENFLNDKK